jgi:hypothetical protein
MDFDLTKAQKMIRDEARNFARKEISNRMGLKLRPPTCMLQKWRKKWPAIR